MSFYLPEARFHHSQRNYLLHCPLILGNPVFPNLSFNPSKSPPALSLYQNKTSCSLLEQRKSHDQFALLKKEREIASHSFLKSLQSHSARSFLSLFKCEQRYWLYTLNRSFLRCSIAVFPELPGLLQFVAHRENNG